MGIPMNAPDGTHYDFGDKVCTELTTFSTFGQWVAVIPDSTGSYATGTRINVATRDALSTFNPLDLQDDKYANVTFDIAGMLSQVQAARPRWLVYSRDPGDICCHRNGAETCPTGVRDCDAIGQ